MFFGFCLVCRSFEKDFLLMIFRVIKNWSHIFVVFVSIYHFVVELFDPFWEKGVVFYKYARFLERWLTDIFQ